MCDVPVFVYLCVYMYGLFLINCRAFSNKFKVIIDYIC